MLNTFLKYNHKLVGRILLCKTVVTALYLQQSSGFSVGVPPIPSVCRSMTPQHHGYPPQTSEPPFILTVNRNRVTSGSHIFVKITTTDPSTKFIGFYIQARNSEDTPIGSFSPERDTKVHSCSGMRANAAHHASGRVKKENVTISWTTPKNYEGEVVLTATVLQDFVTYWVFLETEPVLIVKPSPPQRHRFRLPSQRFGPVRSQPSFDKEVNENDIFSRIGPTPAKPWLRNNSIIVEAEDENELPPKTTGNICDLHLFAFKRQLCHFFGIDRFVLGR